MRSIISLLLLILLSPGLLAATYVVNTFDVDAPESNPGLANCDSDPFLAGDQCTLRAAVMKANNGPGQDTIVIALNQTITLTIVGNGGTQEGDLDVTTPIVITGIALGVPNDISTLPTISASNSDRIFDVSASGDLQLLGMQLSDGIAIDGGALRTAAGGQTVVDRVLFDNNQAGIGGAIYNAGDTQVLRSAFSFNRSATSGSSIQNDGTLLLRDSSVIFSRNEGTEREAIYVAQGSTTELENVLIHGDPQGSNLDTTGITAERPNLLSIRNSVLLDFTLNGLNVIDSDQFTSIRVYNSILAGSSGLDCSIFTDPGDMADVDVQYDLIQDASCDSYYGPGDEVIAGLMPRLDFVRQDVAGFVIYAPPLFNSPVIDAGLPFNIIPADPRLPCLSNDALTTMRPIDGDGDGESRCDIGMIELSEFDPLTFVVNLFNQDLVDMTPGDGVCDAQIAPGDQCTLRAAVMEANAHPGPDRIEFIDDLDTNTIVLTIPTMLGTNFAASGDLDIEEQVEIDGIARNGRPLTTVISSNATRVFDVSLPPGQVALFRELRIQGGDTFGFGGAIRGSGSGITTVRIDDSELFGNSADLGGGAVAALGNVNLIIGNSDLHDNTVLSNGAAVYSERSFTMTRSSVWNNTNMSMSAREAIRAEQGFFLFISNSTISGNTGGVWADGTDTIRLTASTFVNNDQFAVRVANTGGGVPNLALRSSVLAGSGAADCSLVMMFNGEGTDRYNLVEDGSCSPGITNLSGGPMLGVLTQIDGQLTRVHRPLHDSVVLDAVPEADTDACLNLDQHSSMRPTDSIPHGGFLNPNCEIGAIEMTGDENLDVTFLSVNTFAVDVDDLVPGDTLCDSSTAPGMQCTLRAAVMESNAQPGLNVIRFEGSAQTVILDQPDLGGLTSAAHGDLDITDALSILGSVNVADPLARTLIQSSSGDRIFDIFVPPGDSISIRDLRLSGGATPGDGGAVRVVAADNVDLQRMEMFSNTADLGGGALSVTGGVVTLLESDLYNNGTVGEGAAIRNSANLTIDRSSVHDNLDLAVGQREAIANTAGILYVTNSTISTNSGDGIYLSDGTLLVENSTLVGNDGFGIEYLVNAGETLFIRNTVLSDNGSGGCGAEGMAGGGTISTDGFNLSQSSGCDMDMGGSNIIGVDPLLGVLQSLPMEFTSYHLPQIGSPLLDNGHPVVGGIGCLVVDQLGMDRPLDGDLDGSARCDIGAIEAVIVSPPIFSDGFEN